MRESYKKRLNIEFVGLPQLTTKDVKNHLTEQMGFETITGDLGINLISQYFGEKIKPDDIPFDSFWLNIYQGQADPSFYGPPFANI